MNYKNLLSRLTEMSKDVLKENLVGVYLHGSSVMGCFHPNKSDLDLILIVNDDIPDGVKMEFMKHIVKMNEEAPPKGIELSIVKKEFCNPFVYPTPYELHFSNTHLKWFQDHPEEYIEKMKGTDKDLAAHFTIIKQYGVVLFGIKISEVFGNVSKSDYIDSILYDVENAREDILTSTMYMVLNLCRVLAYLCEDLILSKKSGGEWGMKALPRKYHLLVEEAMQAYESDEEMNRIQNQEALLLDFADYMLVQIEQKRMLISK